VGGLKPLFGLFKTLFPVLYCGGLIYYFIHYAGSLQDAEAIGLRPYILGLGVAGLLFSIPLIVKLILIFVALRSPRSGGRDGPDGPTRGGDGGFDADAVVARYMAQRSREEDALGSPVAPQGGRPAGRPGFGRKVR